MKLIEFKEYNNLNKEKVLNKKKVTILFVILAIIIFTVVFSIVYICNSSFRKWADTHVLMKVTKQGNLASIEIDSTETVSVFAYDKYIALLSDNALNIYNSSGKEVEELDVNISEPISKSNGKYLAIAEKEKKNVYLISGTKILWSQSVDNDITQISVNENGYVSIICSGSTYKSIIIVFNSDGEQLIKTYLPNNSVIDSVISSDNKYLSFAEINTSGTLIESTVKTISINDATTSSELSPTYSYEMTTNSLVINLQYQGSKNLICMCNDGVYLLSEGNTQNLMDFSEENKNYTFAGIDLTNSIYEIEEISDGISNQYSEIKLINSGTKKTSKYTINGIAKSTTSSGYNVAINLGTEIYFISTKGWLKKQYTAEEEIRDVVVSDKLAAIVFRDKIEILVL